MKFASEFSRSAPGGALAQIRPGCHVNLVGLSPGSSCGRGSPAPFSLCDSAEILEADDASAGAPRALGNLAQQHPHRVGVQLTRIGGGTDRARRIGDQLRATGR